MTALVYFYANDSAHSEQYLLGTNVVIPLNLMIPHTNLVPNPNNSELITSHPATTAITQQLKFLPTQAMW